MQDAQKGHPARPQRVKGRGVPSGYVEGLNDARTKLAGFFSILLDGFLDFAATQTASADPDALCLAVDQCPNWLQVRFEDPFGLVVGMTDVMAGLATFTTEIACKCHRETPSSTGIDTGLGMSELTTGLFVLTSSFGGRAGVGGDQVLLS